MATGVPDAEEQRNSRQALEEGRAAAQALSPTHLAEVVRAQKQEAESARKDLRTSWSRWWDLWESRVDLSGKEEWQAQIWVPKPFAAVEQACALIQRAVVDSPEFYGVDGQDKQDKLKAQHVWKPLLKVMIDESHFAQKFMDGVKTGFITGVAGYLKFRWQSARVPMLAGAQMNPMTGQVEPVFQPKVRSFLAVDWVDPCKIYRDPDSAPRENFSGAYLYHTEWKDRGAIRAMQQAWNAQVIEEVLADSAGRTGMATGHGMTPSDERERDRRLLPWDRSRFRRQYLVDEGWLDIPDENGDTIFPDALMVHCAGKILYGPVENPLWAVDIQTGRRKWPFLAGSPIVHPSQFEGRGIMEQIQDLTWLYSHLFMLFMDGLNWTVNPPTEVQQDILVDWDDLSHYPGKLWVKKGPTPALTPAAIGKMDVGAILGSLQYLEQITQNVSFVSDFAIGLPGTRSDVTKGEVQIKTAQSLAIFEAMGRNIEGWGRECLEMMHHLGLQFLSDFSTPSVRRILGEGNANLLAQASLAERIEMLQGNFDFTFTGVTQALQKSDQLARLAQFGQLMSTRPYVDMLLQQPQVFLQVLRSYRDTLGLADRIQLPDDPQVAAGPGQMSDGLPPELQALLNGAPNAAQAPIHPGGDQGAVNPAVAAGLPG